MRYSYLYGSAGRTTRYSLDTYKNYKKIIIIASVSFVLVFALLSQSFRLTLNKTNALIEPSSVAAETIPQEESETNQNYSKSVVDQKDDELKQDILTWFDNNSGTYGATIYKDGEVYVEENAHQTFFMASIYKLYTAYIGYQKLDSGEWKDDQKYVNDWSRVKCLDEMIRTSNNQCGEKMMAEIGGKTIIDTLNSYGLEDTSINEFVTSSHDVAKLLARINSSSDLSASSKQKLLASMKEQVYRDGLPKGFSSWTVYDKVGFRDFDEYHDVAIVVSPAGETYIVSILTTGAGSVNIANFASFLKDRL